MPPQEAAQAFAVATAGANEGDPKWTALLGHFYHKGIAVEKDLRMARHYYEVSATAGERIGMNELAKMCLDGDGGARDVECAVRWFEAAANLEYAEAQYNLGVLYTSGAGVPQDYVKANDLFRRSAQQGYGMAYANLGVSAANGDGMPADSIEAYKWWLVALEHDRFQSYSVKLRQNLAELERRMTAADVVEAKRRAESLLAELRQPPAR